MILEDRNLVRCLRLGGAAMCGYYDRQFASALGLSSIATTAVALWWGGTEVARVVFVDTTLPYLGLVLPRDGWSPVRAVLRAYGDAYWKCRFQPGPAEREKEAAARAVMGQMTLRFRSGWAPLPCESIDAFETAYDTLWTPFLFARVLSPGMAIPAVLRTPPRGFSERRRGPGDGV